MMRLLRNKKAQQTAEYAILIAFVIAAAMAIQTYVKRALQGKVRDTVMKFTDDTAELGTTGQYEPYYLESNFNTQASSTKVESELDQGAWQRDVTDDTTNRDGTQTYTAPSTTGE